MFNESFINQSFLYTKQLTYLQNQSIVHKYKKNLVEKVWLFLTDEKETEQVLKVYIFYVWSRITF